MKAFTHRVRIGVLCGAVAVVGLSGCSLFNHEKEAKETGRSTAQLSNDKHLSKRVAAELKTAPIYKYPEVQVTAFNGVVQLSGFVYDESQKAEATRIAQSVAGVNQVRNDLVVQALTPTGRTNLANAPTQAPVITPAQNTGAQEPVPPPQVIPSSQTSTNSSSQP